MIELTAVHPSEMQELVEATGQFDERTTKAIINRGGGEAKSILGEINKVWLGKPQSFDLLELLAAAGEEVPTQISLLAEEADFVAVQFACSFRPAPNSEFIRASVSVQLEPEGAIAYDMYPREVESEVTVKRTFSFSPELKLSFAKAVEVGGKIVGAERSQEMIAYEPEITAYAMGESTPGWDFNKSGAREIRGVKELFLVVKKPKGVSLSSRFQMEATVRTSLGRIPLPSFLSGRSGGPLIDEVHRIG